MLQSQLSAAVVWNASSFSVRPPTWPVLWLSSEAVSISSKFFCLAASCNPHWDAVMERGVHPGVFTPNGFAIRQGNVCASWPFGVTSQHSAVLILSSFSTASACTADKLVAMKLVTFVVGLNLSPEGEALSSAGFQI